MPTVTAGNSRIPYRVVGTGGPGLVLVHGTGPGSGMWDHLLDRFGAAHTVLLPELSGSQDAEDDGGELTVDLLADQVIAVIGDSGLAPVDVVGFSMGAPIAVAVAAGRPELVRRLVPAAGWTDPGDEYLRNMMTVWRGIADNPAAFGRFATLTGFSRDFLNSIGRDAVELNASFMQPTPGLLRQIDLNLRLDIRDLLPRVKAPTLVIGCGQDATIPVDNARRLHAALPGSRYAELDSGHVVVFERATQFTDTVLDFLDAA